jgi:hypothetical protein
VTVRIGIDFDHTLVGYPRVFAALAAEWGLLPPGFTGEKGAVREALLRLPDGERQWQRLQGRIYGKYMDRAEPMEGVKEFTQRARERGAELFIISHKTRHGHFDPQRIDLREAARQWMERHGFFSADGLGFSAQAVFFESTREEKVARIAELGCTVFIDDLPEVFSMPSFPEGVRRCLFAPTGAVSVDPGVEVYPDWAGLGRALLGD